MKKFTKKEITDLKERCYNNGYHDGYYAGYDKSNTQKHGEVYNEITAALLQNDIHITDTPDDWLLDIGDMPVCSYDFIDISTNKILAVVSKHRYVEALNNQINSMISEEIAACNLKPYIVVNMEKTESMFLEHNTDDEIFSENREYVKIETLNFFLYVIPY